MSEFAARIRRVRMKNGGADIRILPQQALPHADEEDYRGALTRNARGVAEMGTADDPLAGYLLVGIFESGRTSVGFRYNWHTKNAIPRMLLPSWVAEVIRRDLIAGEEARDVFNEMFEWQDGG